MKQLLDSFFKLRKEIHDHFGYREDWVTIPLKDGTEYYWNLRKKPDSESYKDVRYHEKPLTQDVLEGGIYHSALIYTQRFLPKWVYRTADYTMICVDTLFIMQLDKIRQLLTEIHDILSLNASILAKFS